MTRPVNPYIAGAPLRGEGGFFGRQDTLEWVARELQNPNNNALVLFGQRRIGKTTLLLQLQRNLPTDTCLPIYFDLQDQAGHPLGQVLADLADTTAEKLGAASSDTSAFDNNGDFFRRKFLPRLYSAVSDPRRPIFLLDEFDVLEQTAEAELPAEAAAKALFPFLRRIMAEEQRPAFVFVVGRRAEDLSLNFMATFKASLVREIWVLDRRGTEAIVRQAEMNGTLKFVDDAVDRIFNLTNGHPYLTQLLCQRVWEQAYADNPITTPTINVSKIETAVSNALETGHQALAWLWDGLSPTEKIYASALAETADEGQTISEDHLTQVLTAHAARLRTREVELAPRDLVKRRVLRETGERQYQFAVELFRRWVRQHKPLQEVKDGLDQVDPLADQFFNVGRSLFQQRRWERAIRSFQEALEANPRHFRARLLLGESLLETSDVDRAMAELEQAYELDQVEARLSLVRALVTYAKAREKAGDEDGALAASRRALTLSPNERMAIELQATIWNRRGDAALAKNEFEAGLAAYREAGNAEKIAEFESLQKRQTLAALDERAKADELAKQWPEAAAAYEQLVAQAPDDERRTVWQTALEKTRLEARWANLFDDGKNYLEQGDLQNARQRLRDLAQQNPEYEKDGVLVIELLRQAINRLNIPLQKPRTKTKPSQRFDFYKLLVSLSWRTKIVIVLTVTSLIVLTVSSWLIATNSGSTSVSSTQTQEAIRISALATASQLNVMATQQAAQTTQAFQTDTFQDQQTSTSVALQTSTEQAALTSTAQAQLTGTAERRTAIITTLSAIKTSTAQALVTASDLKTATAQAGLTATARVRSTIDAVAIQNSALTATALASVQELKYGPTSGDLAHDVVDGFSEASFVNGDYINFIVEARFFNPYSTSTGSWANGFYFRDTRANGGFQINIGSSGIWYFYNGSHLISLQSSGAIDVSEGGSNLLKLIAQNNTGKFYINNIFAGNLDLSARPGAGRIAIGTGMLQGSEIDGKITHYEGFSVWSLP